MTFQEYLVGRQARADAQGDFIRLARAEDGMAGATSWTEVKSRLEARRVSADIIKAGEQVWIAYQIWVRRRGNA